jgi:hypothetical protein
MLGPRFRSRESMADSSSISSAAEVTKMGAWVRHQYELYLARTSPTGPADVHPSQVMRERERGENKGEGPKTRRDLIDRYRISTSRASHLDKQATDAWMCRVILNPEWL